MPGKMAGRGDAPERGQAISAQALCRFLDGAIHADEARGDEAHRPGYRDQDVTGDQTAE